MYFLCREYAGYLALILIATRWAVMLIYCHNMDKEFSITNEEEHTSVKINVTYVVNLDNKIRTGWVGEEKDTEV